MWVWITQKADVEAEGIIPPVDPFSFSQVHEICWKRPRAAEADHGATAAARALTQGGLTVVIMCEDSPFGKKLGSAHWINIQKAGIVYTWYYIIFIYTVINIHCFLSSFQNPNHFWLRYQKWPSRWCAAKANGEYWLQRQGPLRVANLWLLVTKEWIGV